MSHILRSPESAAPRALVIFLCETRAWEITAKPFRTNVLEPLEADLGLCVADGAREEPNPFYEMARFVWSLPEPDDWSDLFEAESGGHRLWQALVELDKTFLGGLGSGAQRTPGSGAIIMYFRRFAERCLREDGLLDAYDWFIFTRSDFYWPTPHPPLAVLDDTSIHALDGEQYGGVSDRYAAVPRALLQAFLTVPDPIFDEPLEFAVRARAEMATAPQLHFNPERFIAMRLRELGLWNGLKWLPYVPYSVRTPAGHTSWSKGTFDSDKGFFIKYPDEHIRSRAVTAVIHDSSDWLTYFDHQRGHRMRIALRFRTWFGLQRSRAKRYLDARNHKNSVRGSR